MRVYLAAGVAEFRRHVKRWTSQLLQGNGRAASGCVQPGRGSEELRGSSSRQNYYTSSTRSLQGLPIAIHHLLFDVAVTPLSPPLKNPVVRTSSHLSLAARSGKILLRLALLRTCSFFLATYALDALLGLDSRPSSCRISTTNGYASSPKNGSPIHNPNSHPASPHPMKVPCRPWRSWTRSRYLTPLTTSANS